MRIRSQILQCAFHRERMSGEHNILTFCLLPDLFHEFTESCGDRRKRLHPLRNRIMDKIRKKHPDLRGRIRQIHALVRTIIHFDQTVLYK